MAIWPIYKALQTIALHEFGDIVVSAAVLTLPTGDPLKLRLDISDGSMLDVYLSVSGRYSYHLVPAGQAHRHTPHRVGQAVTDLRVSDRRHPPFPAY